MSPFQAVYGIPPPVHLPYVVGDSVNDVVDHICLLRELTLQNLKTHLSRAQNRIVQQANKGRTKHSFEEGEMVYLKLHPFRRNMLNNSSLHKLAVRYFGPFNVLKKVGVVAYELDLRETTRIHPVMYHC